MDHVDEPADELWVEPAQTRPRLMREYACTNCHRRFRIDVFGPRFDCRACRSRESLWPVCRSCHHPVARVRTPVGWRCTRCEDAHAVAAHTHQTRL